VGYCVYTTDFDLPADKVPAAFEAVKEAIKKASTGPEETQLANEAKSLKELFWKWGWELVSDDGGDIVEVYTEGSVRLSNDDVLFRALGPFVRRGSFVEIRGEDDDFWRWAYTGNEMVEQDPDVRWGELPMVAMAKDAQQQMLAVVQQQNKELKARIKNLEGQLSSLENSALKAESRITKAEDDREALFAAVRALAVEVSVKTSAGIAARSFARKKLESRKITPPSTLGKSRQRRQVKGRRKKKT